MRILFASIVFTLFAAIAAAQSDPVKQIAPLLDDQTFLLAHLDLSKVDLQKIADNAIKQAEENIKDLTTTEKEAEDAEQQLNMAKMMIPMLIGQAESQVIKPLVEDGKVTDVYLLCNLRGVLDEESQDSISQPAGFYPAYFAIPTEGKTEDEIKAIKGVFGLAGNDSFPVRFQRFGFYIAVVAPPVDEEAIAELVKKNFKEIKVVERPEFAEAFKALGDTTLQFVLMKPKGYDELTFDKMIEWTMEDARISLDEFESLATSNGVPESKDGALADILQEQVTKGLRWTAAGVDLDKYTFKWVIQSNNPGGAKKTLAAIDRLVDLSIAVAIAESHGEIPFTKEEIREFVAHFLLKETKNEQLEVVIDEQLIKKHSPVIKEKIAKAKKAAEEAAEKMRCSNNIKQMMLAMHNYHATHNSLPSSSTMSDDKKPLHSWRVAILPFIEQQALYSEIKFDEPWDSEHNKQFHDQMPEIYACPDAPAEEAEKGLTHYAVVVGKDSLFTGPNNWIGLGSVTDGTSSTLGVTERTKAVCWMDPSGDISQESAEKGINKKIDDGIGSPHKRGETGGVFMGALDGSVRFVPDTTDEKTIKAIITKSGGELNGFPDDQPQAAARPVRPKRVQSCTNNLKMIGLAMHNFHDVQGQLPNSARTFGTAGGPMHSWRVELLPYMEETALYEAIKRDEPWDSEHNKQFHDKMPSVYRCTDTSEEEAKKGLTHYAMVTGEGTPFVEPDQNNTLAYITDGTSNTIFVTEKLEPVCWMDPSGDIDITKIEEGINQDEDGIGSPHKVKGEKGVYVVLFDGSVQFISEDYNVDDLKALIDPRDGRSVSLP